MKNYNYKGLIVLLALCALNLLFMHVNVLSVSQIEDPLDVVSWIDNLCRVFLDVMILFSIFVLLLWGSFRYSILLTFAITFIWSFSNVLYSRFFFHYITLSSMGEVGAIADDMVINSMVAGIRICDFYYVVILFLFLWLYYKCTFPNVKLWCYMRIGLVLLLSIYTFDISSHVLYCISQAELRYWGYCKRRISRRVFGQNHFFALPIYAHFHNGSIKSIIIESYMTIKGDIELNETQKNIILKTIKQSGASMVRRVCNEEIKNVIFILVESQMSFVIDKNVSGKEITPYLNSLKSDSSVYYNGNVHPNISIGESSDGQYIYMTGVLPLRSILTVSKACKKILPGLPRQLRKVGINHSRMILPTSPSLWRQDEMCNQYGFEHLYSSNDYPGKHKQTLTDIQVFDLASKLDSEDPYTPFFSIILTASMHQPYNKLLDPTFETNDLSINEELKCYLNACHYTDNAIGNYLISLKNKGLYNNSLIVIASDHHVHSTDFGGGISTDLPLFIINGNKANCLYKGPCNQLDVYTTIVDLMNIPNPWPGLGISLLNSKYNGLDLKTRWDVSEWVLLSDFYKTVSN